MTGYGERKRPKRAKTSVLNRGEAMQWITGGGLVLGILMIIGLMAMIIINGLGAFWPHELERVTTREGKVYLGEIWRHQDHVKQGAPKRRTLYRTGNHDLYSTHTTWVEHDDIAETSREEWDLVVERMAKGRFYGTPVRFVADEEDPKEGEESPYDTVLAEGAAKSMALVDAHHPRVVEDLARILEINKVDIGRANARIRQAEVAASEAAVALRTRAMRPAMGGGTGAWLGVACVLVGLVLVLSLWYRRQADEDAKRQLGTGVAAVAGVLLVLVGLAAWVSTREPTSAEDAAARLEAARDHHAAVKAENDALIKQYEADKTKLVKATERYALVCETVEGIPKTIPLSMIARVYAPNRLGFWGRFGVYVSRWWEYLSADPREANSAGGIFPVILGTVVMTLLMTVIAVPFGVLAALYLREYAKGGVIVSAIRISINNLAGVPSIVFGVFGLGFFCYGFGRWIDGGAAGNGVPGQGLSVGTWLAALAGLGTSVMLAVIAGLGRRQHDLMGRGGRVGAALLVLVLGLDLFFSWLVSPYLAVAVVVLVLLLILWPGKGGSHVTSPVHRALDRSVILMWTKAVLVLGLFIWGNPFFTGFYTGELPNPHYGKGGVLWASLTLALLTLPVVIVATEEALSAVPNSMRHGSYACGASKWQTIRRIVLPRATPGILTGTILAMARGAGEVAPLMLVGAVNMAPELPVNLFDWSGSFAGVPLGPLHPDRSFMHLGFHVYDLAMQSPNAEAAKPMVFTTTLLLILIVAVLNLTAIAIRSRIRRKYVGEKV